MTKPVHIMVDLETMGTNSNAPIVSIGAVVFSEKEVTDKVFQQNVSLKSCMELGMKPDPDTIMWWLQQSEEARKSLTERRPENLSSVLLSFRCWLLNVSDRGLSGLRIWGNGANFDNVILANAYRACFLDVPWKHYQDRCFRTFRELHEPIEQAQYRVEHDALSDAVSQAMTMVLIHARDGTSFEGSGR